MDSRLKQRLIGAAVLVALAVIFLPMLVQGPAPDSGVSDVPLSMPDAPRGDYETRDLPLVTPGERPDGGVVGMGPAVSAPASAPAAVPDATSASQPQAMGNDTPAVAEALPASPSPSSPPAAAMFPAPTAGGDYAVSFGTYATAGAADAVVAPLRASQLPGYREAANVNGKSLWRVRIGPYASRADAEAARLRAAHVRDDVGARVIALDAPVAAATPKPVATSPATPSTAKPAVPPVTRAAADTGFAIQLAAYSKSADAMALRDRLRAAGFTAFTESVATDKGALTRVRVGPVMTRAEAEQLRALVKVRLGLDGIVRPHP
jgi:cell division septation protein DedD